MDILANNIALIRSRWGMEQIEFAELMGVTRFVVGNWERRNTPPDLATIVRLETLSGFPLAVLLGRELMKEEIPVQPFGDGAPVVSQLEEIREELGEIKKLVQRVLQGLP